MAKQDKSIRWNVTMCMILVAYLASGFLAGSYAGNSGGAVAPVVGRRTSGIIMLIMGMYSFIATSIVQLPNFVSVIMWHLQNRIWLPILFVVLECGIVAGGYGLEKLENNLAGPKILPSGKKKRKRSAG
jgi:uncharacterized membrane protein YhdT